MPEWKVLLLFKRLKTEKETLDNARTDTYENFFAAGVIDPAKVTRGSGKCSPIAGMFFDNRM